MIYLAGLGPGRPEAMTQEVRRCLNRVDVILGYSRYVEMARAAVGPDGGRFESGEIGQEMARARRGLELAADGREVAIVSGGDTGIYGMAAAVFEALQERGESASPLRVLPGVSALNAASARLGAPVAQDFATVSLSDHLTPWSTIEDRLHHAACGDFVVVIYNPRSRQRRRHLPRALEILGRQRPSATPVGLVRNAYRDDESVRVGTLDDVEVEDVDMLTTLVVGNSETRRTDSWIYTPRGYGRNRS